MGQLLYRTSVLGMNTTLLYIRGSLSFNINPPNTKGLFHFRPSGTLPLVEKLELLEHPLMPLSAPFKRISAPLYKSPVVHL